MPTLLQRLLVVGLILLVIGLCVGAVTTCAAANSCAISNVNGQ